jgi:hypothetical protein
MTIRMTSQNCIPVIQHCCNSSGYQICGANYKILIIPLSACRYLCCRKNEREKTVGNRHFKQYKWIFFTFMWPCCIVTNFFVIKPTRCTNFTNLFCHETTCFGTVRLSIIRSLLTVRSAMYYVVQALYTQLSSRTRMELELLESCVYSACTTYTLLSVQLK